MENAVNQHMVIMVNLITSGQPRQIIIHTCPYLCIPKADNMCSEFITKMSLTLQKICGRYSSQDIIFSIKIEMFGKISKHELKCFRIV